MLHDDQYMQNFKIYSSTQLFLPYGSNNYFIIYRIKGSLHLQKLIKHISTFNQNHELYPSVTKHRSCVRGEKEGKKEKGLK